MPQRPHTPPEHPAPPDAERPEPGDRDNTKTVEIPALRTAIPRSPSLVTVERFRPPPPRKSRQSKKR